MIRTKLISAIAVSVCFVAMAAGASAQGRYNNPYRQGDLQSIVSGLDNSSGVFARDFANVGGTSSGERRVVDRFQSTVSRLRRKVDNNNNPRDSRNEAQRVLTEARQLEPLMNNNRYSRQLGGQWVDLRRDINDLANVYGLSGLNGQVIDNGGGYGQDGGSYGGNGGGYGGGPIGPATRPPDWAVGTWYWVQGPNRVFSIDRNGIVTENAGGYQNQGTYSRGSLYLNGNKSTVTRTSTGIRTYNTATGETSDYTRSAYGGNGNDGGNWDGGGGNMTRPPNWAVGTWSWVQGYGRQFTVEASGRVIENTGGRVSYGTYNNGVISLNGNNSTVTRTRNGIRTYNESTGETSDYVRQ